MRASALVRQAGALAVVAQFAHQRIVDALSLVGGRSGIRVLYARAGLLDHVAHAGARPRAHAEKDIVHVAERVEPQHGRIDPAIDRNVGRTEHGLLSSDRNRWSRRKRRQQHRAGEKSSLEPTYTQIHIPHFITGLP
jgi:NAD(P)-dependent dehydrogenase (short-subunit alcohol dehydrogenase family)